MKVKMTQKMVIFAKALDGMVRCSKMFIFHLILFSFSSSFFENEIEKELENEPEMAENDYCEQIKICCKYKNGLVQEEESGKKMIKFRRHAGLCSFLHSSSKVEQKKNRSGSNPDPVMNTS